MNVVMRRPRSAVATAARRAFFGSLAFPHGTILDLDFDNDNDKPLTDETLDWHLARHWPVGASD